MPASHHLRFRHVRHLALLAVAGLMVGCLPLSISPLYEGEGDVVFDASLLGTWAPVDGDDADAWGTWTFDRAGEGPFYTVRVDDGEGHVGIFHAGLVDLDGRRYLSLYPLAHEPDVGEVGMNPWFLFHLRPLHSFASVRMQDGGLTLAMVDLQKLTDLLRRQPGLIDHRFVEGEPGDRPMPILTASSAALKAFVREYLADESLYQTSPLMRRVAAAATQPMQRMPEGE